MDAPSSLSARSSRESSPELALPSRPTCRANTMIVDARKSGTVAFAHGNSKPWPRRARFSPADSIAWASRR